MHLDLLEKGTDGGPRGRALYRGELKGTTNREPRGGSRAPEGIPEEQNAGRETGLERRGNRQKEKKEVEKLFGRSTKGAIIFQPGPTTS